MPEIRMALDESFTNEIKKMMLQAANDVIQEAAAREKKPAKDWMNQKEACSWLGISFPTLQEWRRMGLKVAAVQGKTLISKAEINRFLESYQQ